MDKDTSMFICLAMVAAFGFFWYFRRQRKEYTFFKNFVYGAFEGNNKLTSSFVEETRTKLNNIEKTAKGPHTKYSFGQMRDYYNKFVEFIPNELEKKLLQPNFSYQDYLALKELYREECDRCQPVSELDVLETVRQEVLLYVNGTKKPKHYAERMVGFLIQKGLLSVEQNDYAKTWRDFVGDPNSKVELSHLRNPEYNKNSKEKDSFNLQLDEIKAFLASAGVEISS